jgi:hypothetical protein
MYVQIPDFPNYFVNHEGEVVSLARNTWKVLVPIKSSNGYLHVDLSKDGKKYTISIHRLVMWAWAGKSELQVNHKNCDKADNRLENLEYCTNSENGKHAWVNGRFPDSCKQALLERMRAGFGERNSASKLTDAQAAQLLALKGKISQGQAGKLFGVTRTTVGDIWRGKRWKHLERVP